MNPKNKTFSSACVSSFRKWGKVTREFPIQERRFFSQITEPEEVISHQLARHPTNNVPPNSPHDGIYTDEKSIVPLNGPWTRPIPI